MRIAARSILVLALCCLLPISAARAQSYVKRDTWAESMVATRATLGESRGDKAFHPYASGVMRGGDKARQIDIDVTGLDSLCLEATIGGDNYSSDQTVWAEAVLLAADGSATKLRDLKPASHSVGWGKLYLDRNHGGVPISVAGRTFAHGVYAHAPSRLVYDLGGRHTRFQAWIGIDGADANGSSEFLVYDARSGTQVLWNRFEQDFPVESAAMKADAPDGSYLRWFEQTDSAMERGMMATALDSLGGHGVALSAGFKKLVKANPSCDAPDWLAQYAQAAQLRHRLQRVAERVKQANLPALRRAVDHLAATYPGQYDTDGTIRRRLTKYERKLDGKTAGFATSLRNRKSDTLQAAEELLAFRREALLANPLLDFDTILLVKRSEKSPGLGLPANWQGNCSLARHGYDDATALLQYREPDAEPQVTFKPKSDVFVGDVDLHYDATHMLFSMTDEQDCWQIWEVGIDGTGLRKVTPHTEKDVDNYDACYLPDGRIIFTSTAPMRAVPCVDGSSHVANLYTMNADGTGIRQLGFDQEHSWCPTVLNNGRVLYLRWEYTDTPHSQTRLLFHMNPDGTAQMEYCHSNSYWPNGTFYARSVPGHPTMVAGIVTGHHGVRRMGELVLFDPAKGRREADSAVQRIPGHGQNVETIIRDQLVDASWPKFLHPYPLSRDFFLASCKPSNDAPWGIYLVDVFDNILLLQEQPGYALLEPTPLRTRQRPPVIPDRVDLARDDAVVYLQDIYAGEGLKGIPRGAVKQLRLIEYHYSYRGMGGLLGVVGMDGPWDIKRVVGTVPVEEDGSAMFRVPANMPLAVQPLDSEGKALQLMRSWFTAMPGETLSCVGCHEPQNASPDSKASMAALKAPSDITPWRGPVRGFSFAREVQPVLDQYCVSCHLRSEGAAPNLRGDVKLTDWKSVTPGQGGRLGGRFSVGYANLHKFVRRPGIESDYHMLTPMEFHADTTELVQMLQQGHHSVRLDDEAWDRLVTWIDLNAPYHGYWHEVAGPSALQLAERQCELGRIYGGLTVNPEIIPETAPLPTAPIMASPAPARQAADTSWAFTTETAAQLQTALGADKQTIDLGNALSLEMVLIPAGTLITESGQEVTIERPFWMSTCEVTNGQYAAFDPTHDSRVETKHAYQFGVHGFPVNGPQQPVVRVSPERADAFCAWLTQSTGQAFTLPTEGQWEWACRAGAATEFHFGALGSDFSGSANLADMKLREFADNPYQVYAPLANATPYDDWIPRNNSFNDGALVSADVGGYQANTWGLHDMHGNVWEWTAATQDDKRVARGGSWYDRPKRATASFRIAYRPHQRVFNVGFRVVCGHVEDAAGAKVARVTR
ncbi:MAG: SUMF1/EgtB/PvdO family nonheme iron enzyme [bacterium]|nr:SUMF1/EgtB/PvdO family nonheme iron enzyme [bacterium]